MIAFLLILLQSPFQRALDAAPLGATVAADAYAPAVKRDVVVRRAVTITGGIFVGTLVDRALSRTPGPLVLAGARVYGNVRIGTLDRFVLLRSQVWGDVRSLGDVELVDSLVVARQNFAWQYTPHHAPEGIVARDVSLLRSFVKGSTGTVAQPCASRVEGGVGVRCRILTTYSPPGFMPDARPRGGPGLVFQTCRSARGAPFVAETWIHIQ